MRPMIDATEIVGLKYEWNLRHSDKLFFSYKDVKDADFIKACIISKYDYRYFDKYGTEFGITEIRWNY